MLNEISLLELQLFWACILLILHSWDAMKQTIFCCHDCGIVNRVASLPSGGKAFCSRCDALLRRSCPDGIVRALALAIAALILLLVSLSFPFLRMENAGLSQQSNLLTSVFLLFEQRMPIVALVVMVTCVGVPGLYQLGMVYVLLPLRYGRKAPQAVMIFRLLRSFGSWGMVEIFLFGILVALVKLVKMATVSPGISFWSLFILIFVIAAQSVVFEPLDVWEELEAIR